MGGPCGLDRVRCMSNLPRTSSRDLWPRRGIEIALDKIETPGLVERQATPEPAPQRGALMRQYTLTHLSDTALLRDLAALVARDRLTIAALLAHLAEVDARRLYVPA